MKSTTKKYYILDPSFKIIPLKNYKFSKNESYLQLLVNEECVDKKFKSKNKNPKLEKLIKEMGFEWEPLSEFGQMRQTGYANTIMEAIEKYVWLIVKQFGEKENIPIYKVSGGELFNPNSPELKKHLLMLSRNPTLYGVDFYRVTVDNEELILRYSACTQKLSITKGFTLSHENLPIGLFEISKSYRFEKEDELQLCKRVRSFYLPELHIITDSVSSSLKLALAIHLKILAEIKKLDSNYELLCSVTTEFFKKNVNFLKSIVKSINKPILLVVYDKNTLYEDGVEVNIDYKVFDTENTPLEAATFQIDDGTTDSAFNIKYQSNKGSKKPVSTIHVVFAASVERFAYLLLDRGIRMETKTGVIQLPFWVAPIQVRIIPYKESLLGEAEKLAKKLENLNFRVDLDDRIIPYNIKKREKDLRWIPYIITVYKSSVGKKYLRVKNKIKKIDKIMSVNNLIKEMKRNKNIIVPRYTPMLLSKRVKSSNS